MPDSNPISALISRLTHEDHSDQGQSGKLDEPILGWLSILVTFLGEPVSNIAVWFYNQENVEQRDVGTPAPPKTTYHERHDPNINPAGWTDGDGKFRLSQQVPVGTYTCKLQGQPDTRITTVEDADDPFVLVLPIGRSYFDIYGTLVRPKH